MISENTVNAVKEAARIVDVIGEFVELKKNGSGYECCCPFHSEKTPSFKVEPKDNFYKCFGGCDAAGDSLQFLMQYKKWDYPTAVKHLANKYRIPVEVQNEENKKTYTRPLWKNTLTLDDNVVKWFENERKISQATLNKMKVTSEIEWMPEGKIKKGNVPETIPAGKRKVIAFNYFKDGELINRKLRDRHKTMRMDKDAELIWYNIDSLKGATKIFILEGEGDQLTLVECGIDLIPGTAILSVPNGANIKSNNLAYLDSSIDLFHPDAEIILGVDDDIAGRKLREDLSERFGKERCKYIEWKGKKDANEVLVAYGKQGVIECCADKKEFPLEGVFTVSSFDKEIDDMYENGIESGCKVGMENFDKLLSFVKGYITTIVGIPGHGKSQWMDQVALMLLTRHDWKFAFYSPENKPTKMHFSKMARLLVGKSWIGREKLSIQEKDLVKRHLEGKIWWIKPEKDFTLDNILASVKSLKMRHGVDAFCIDAWSRLEHKYSGKDETKYIGESLIKLANFCELQKVHCFLIAHPTKMKKDKGGKKHEIPTLYDISGSAHFFNMTDNGMCVYRDYMEGVTKVIVQKVKFQPEWGEPGVAEFKYDKYSGRFNESVGGASITDLSNWITKENRQAVMQIPSEPIGIITNADYEDPPF